MKELREKVAGYILDNIDDGASDASGSTPDYMDEARELITLIRTATLDEVKEAVKVVTDRINIEYGYDESDEIINAIDNLRGTDD